MTDGEFVLAMPEMEALAIQSLLAANGIDARPFRHRGNAQSAV